MYRRTIFSPGGTPRLHGRQDVCRYDHPRICLNLRKLLYFVAERIEQFDKWEHSSNAQSADR
jgi:hypothetical protein